MPLVHFSQYLVHFFSEWEMLQAKFVEKIKIHVLCSVTSPTPPPENLAVYEIIWKNILEPDMAQMTVQRMLIACWIPKATDTQTEYVMLNVFPRQQWLRERATVTFIAHCRVCSFTYSFTTTHFSHIQTTETLQRTVYLHIITVQQTRCQVDQVKLKFSLS